MLKLLPPFEAASSVTFGMLGIALTMAMVFVAAVFHAARQRTVLAAMVIAAVMISEIALANSGLLQAWSLRPPPFMLMFVSLTIMTTRLSFSRLGHALATGLPYWALIAAQSFRLPLEMLMHQAAAEGLMPPQLSYTGYNYDIVTGASAVIISILVALGLAPRGLIRLWNVMGLVLLAIVVGLAIASMPILHLFGPDQLNTWVTYAPFVWLPGLMVPIALLGHLLLWRKLKDAAVQSERCGVPA